MIRYVVAVAMSLCVALSAWAANGTGQTNVPGQTRHQPGLNGIVRSGSMVAEILPDGALRRISGEAEGMNAAAAAQPGAGPKDGELLLNPGFESGSLAPWTQEGSDWSVVDSTPRTGTYCAFDIENHWLLQSFAPTPGASISSITWWERQPDPLVAAVDLMYDDGTYSESLIHPTSAWQQFDATAWVDRSKILNGIRFWGYSGPGSQETFLDDVSIQVLSSDTMWRYGPFSSFGFTRFDGEYFPGTGKVYFLGGRKADASTNGAVWSYDVATRTYAATGATLPTPISNYTIALLQDDYDLPSGDTWGLYVFGGRVEAGTFTNATQVYYPRTNRVVTVTSDPYPNSTGGISYIPGDVPVHGNKAYALGGFQSTTAPYISNAVWVFDPLASAGSRWTQSPYNLAYGRGYISGAVVDTFLYACGGDTFDGTNLYARAQVQRFNLSTPGAWTLVSPMPQVCGEARAFGFGSATPYYRDVAGDLAQKIIVAGRGDWPNEDSLCFAYDAPTDAWGVFPHLLRARRNHAAAFIPGADSNGVPGMWVWGGRHTSDAIVGDTTEFFALHGVPAQPTAFKVLLGIADDYGPQVAADIMTAGAGAFSAVDYVDWRAGTLRNVDSVYSAGYEVILTWPNYAYLNDTMVGDSLAKYVEIHGGVVSPVWCEYVGGNHMEGRYMSRYNPVPFGGNLFTLTGLGTVHQPGHPIMQGVGTVSCTYATDVTSVKSSSYAERLADWNTGQVECATYDSMSHRTAFLGYSPNPYSDVTLAGDWMTQLVNALKWVRYAPQTGQEEEPLARVDYALRVAPNPFSGSATISFSLPAQANVSVRLYSITGALVSELASGQLGAGTHSVSLHSSQPGLRLAKGVYLLRFETKGFETTKKLILE